MVTRILAAICALACGAEAQCAHAASFAVPFAAPFHGPVRHFELDFATGVLVETTPAVARAVTFSNTTTSGFYGIQGSGEEWVDWGVKAGASSGLVAKVTVSYATFEIDPSVGGPGASLDLALYSGTTGSGTLGSEVFRTSLTGLPGAGVPGGPAGAFVVTVDLSSAPISLPDGNVGWGYAITDPSSGPILVSVGADPTGTVDLLDVYATPTTAATYTSSFSFSIPSLASTYLRLEEVSGLVGVPSSLSLASGGSQVLSLAASPALAGRNYLILGSLSGTSPGVPWGAKVVPLNPDPYLLFTLLNPNTPLLNGSAGVLNSLAQATAVFTLAPGAVPSLAGLTVHHAGLVTDLVAGVVSLPEVTNTAALTLLP